MKLALEWRAAAAVWLLALAPVHARAQITGEVRDITGRPVPSAHVELWGDSTRCATALAGSDGQFVLTANPAATRVLAFGLGTDSAWVPLGDLLHPLRVVLKPHPLELPGLEAVATPMQCPRSDDRAARALWRRVAATYEPTPDTAVWGAQVVELRRGVTRPDDFGAIGPAIYVWAQMGGGWFASVPLADQPLSDAWIQRHGYAQPIAMSSMDGREEAWHYLALDGAQARHLGSPVFAALQRFGFEKSRGSAQALVFCSRDRHEPGIRGRILLDQAQRVLRVEWQFTTPKPAEDAGGQATFSPDARHLLPISGEFWRRTPTGRYFQETERYGPWFVGDSTGLRVFMQGQRQKARARAAGQGGSG